MYYLICTFATLIKFIISRQIYGPQPKNEISLPNVLIMGFVNCLWPVFILYYVLERTIGPYLPEPNGEYVARADSLMAYPSSKDQENNAGANYTNAPDRL